MLYQKSTIGRISDHYLVMSNLQHRDLPKDFRQSKNLIKANNAILYGNY